MTKQNSGAQTSQVKQSQTPATLGNSSQTPSERFTEMVIREFTGHSGSPALSTYQKRLIQNYFISIDLAIKTAEEKRMKKSEQKRDQLPIAWQNINMQMLAVNVVACSRIGYDPALPNHINMMPFKNNTIQKYDIVFIPGYRGKELMAMKYGFDVPDDVVVEVVYSEDKFVPIKKDKNNDVESYIFEVSKDPFNRGEIVGGFYYHVYSEAPKKNRLVFYNLHEIEKRKPRYASAEFWGGTRDKWENGQKKGTEKVEGWFHEMVWKTIYRAAYGAITIDGKKIDDDLMQMLEMEKQHEYDIDPELRVDRDGADKNRTVEGQANKKNLNIEEAQVVEDEPKDVIGPDGKPHGGPGNKPKPNTEYPMTEEEAHPAQPDKEAEDKAYEEAMAEVQAQGQPQQAKAPF